jgi:hypothetical protein
MTVLRRRANRVRGVARVTDPHDSVRLAI